MADEYDNEMRGVLFKNDKRGNDKAPDYKGKVQVKGVEYDLSSWVRTSQRGQKYMSLKLELPREQQGGAAPAPQATTTAPATAPTGEDFGMPPGSDPDDIPF